MAIRIRVPCVDPAEGANREPTVTVRFAPPEFPHSWNSILTLSIAAAG